VEEYGTARHVTDDNIMLHRKDVISLLGNWGKNTDTHTNTHTQNI